MKTATLDRSMEQTTATSVAAMAAPTPTTTSVSKTAVLVGLCFLTATFTFAIGNALIHSYFSSATAHNAPHRRGVPPGLLRPRGRRQRCGDAANPYAACTDSLAGLPRPEGDGVPHTRGGGRRTS